MASVFQEEPLINLTAIVQDEAPVFFGKGSINLWFNYKDAPIGVASSDNLSYLLPPVNHTPSLALGHLIYWGLLHGTPFG